MMQQDGPALECRMLDTGYCLAWEHHLIQGGHHRLVACHSLVALLGHPAYGWLLWDTGYAPRIYEATQSLPYWFYARATPMRLQPELAVAVQLGRWGIRPEDITRVIISHFHADHIAGLRDFPGTQFIALRSAYDDVAWRRGLRALRRGFIPALLPADFGERTILLAPFVGPALPGLGHSHDLLGDGSLLLVELPGHARGQIGLFARTTRGRVLFAADACWLSRSIDERRPPARITHLFVDDPQAVRATIEGLHAFSQAWPDVRIIPSHCPEAYMREVVACE